MLVSAPVCPNVMTPPDLDLVKVPVGDSGVSSISPELPQHTGVEEEGAEGKALPAGPVTETTLVSSVPVTEHTNECRVSAWFGLKSVK